MVKRPTLIKRSKVSPVSRDTEDAVPKFFSSGCTLLDCALGGGWAIGRVANIVGESATGKTLLGIEAAANFRIKFPQGRIIHIDTEAAFDPDYANTLGVDTDAIELHEDFSTVEDIGKFFGSLLSAREKAKSAEPCLLILDSIDALTTKSEEGRSMDEGTFGLEKPKLLSQLFRRYIRRLAATGVTLMIMSQVRANVNAGPFGKQTVQGGGKSLRFYCTQVLELTHLKQLKRDIKKVTRVTGIMVKGKVEKNRCGPAHRSVEFPLMFSYGIEDERASLEFLARIGRGDEVGIENTLGAAASAAAKLDKLPPLAAKKSKRNLRKVVRKVWKEIEQAFAPVRRKYE